jgi:hypothetical protein
MRLSSRTKLLLAGGSLFALLLSGALRYSDVCHLAAVELDGSEVQNWDAQYEMLHDGPLTSQPVDSLMQSLLQKPDIYRVDVAYRLPNLLMIETNRFAPTAFLLCNKSGRMYGLTLDARIVPLDRAKIDWEQPVLTGAYRVAMFDYCSDPRVKLVCRQLELLREAQVDLYRLIDEIDFSRDGYLQMTLSGLNCRLRLRGERLFEDVNRFVQFASSCGSELQTMKIIDMRFDEMVVCQKGA